MAHEKCVLRHLATVKLHKVACYGLTDLPWSWVHAVHVSDQDMIIFEWRHCDSKGVVHTHHLHLHVALQALPHWPPRLKSSWAVENRSMQGIQYAAYYWIVSCHTCTNTFGRHCLLWQPKWKPQQPNFLIFIQQTGHCLEHRSPLFPRSFPPKGWLNHVEAPWHILTHPTMSDLSQQSFNAQSQTQALPPCGPAGNTDKHSRNQPSYISLLLYILSDYQLMLGAPSSKTWGIKGGPSTQVDRSMVQIKTTSRIENWTSRSGLLIGTVEVKPVAHSCQFWAVFGIHDEIRWNTYVCHIMCRRTKVQADYLSTLPAAPRCWFFVSAAPDESTITRCHPFVTRYEYPQKPVGKCWQCVFLRWVKTVNSHAIMDKFPLQAVNQQELWFF